LREVMEKQRMASIVSETPRAMGSLHPSHTVRQEDLVIGSTHTIYSMTHPRTSTHVEPAITVLWDMAVTVSLIQASDKLHPGCQSVPCRIPFSKLELILEESVFNVDN
ncbi:hypothetical protein KIPB_015546, partial [Kipferlia bialata]